MNIYKAMGGVAGVGAVCFALAAAIGNHEHGVKGVFAAIGWFGFLASVLVLILLALAALGRSVYRRTTTA
jgi:uncharacterized membrane protein YdjX (TVP38/TMEM64 family)